MGVIRADPSPASPRARPSRVAAPAPTVAASITPVERRMNDMTGLAVALDVIALVVLVSLATGEAFVPVTAVVVAPLAAGAFSRPVTTLFATALALVAGVGIGIRGGLWGTGDLVGRCAIIAIGGAVGAVLAAIRERREASLERTGDRLRSEHAVVSVLQQSFLPSSGSNRLRSLEVAASYRPVNGRADVGGDWFDVFMIDDDRLGISIGDVAGHGLDSAVLMVQLRLGIRLAALRGADPGAVLDETGRLLHSVAPDSYATAVFGVYDARTHAWAWSRAGHCLPVLASPTQARLLDDPAGPLLGLCTGTTYPTNHLELDVEHVLVLHTDGLYERHDRSIAVGEAVLVDLLPVVLEGRDDLQRIVDWLPGLVHETEPEDDICVLALRRRDDTSDTGDTGDTGDAARDPLG